MDNFTKELLMYIEVPTTENTIDNFTTELTINFKYKGEEYKFEFTPENEDWWTAFPSKIKGIEFDVHYNEDYGDISVYEVVDGENNNKLLHHKRIEENLQTKYSDTKVTSK